MNNIKLPTHCPSCEAELVVTQLSCNTCSTTINESYVLPEILKLSPSEQDFILQFFLTSGSLKQMALQLTRLHKKDNA